jgi:hypothetical protein
MGYLESSNRLHSIVLVLVVVLVLVSDWSTKRFARVGKRTNGGDKRQSFAC